MNKHQEYERRKKELPPLSSNKYEQKIKELAKELNL